MIIASRRIFFYWLLLIIPALVVGTAALWLLRREQIRINEQAAAAAAAQQAAVQARTRLIAENIDVIITDVENGLMRTLLDAPVENPGEYLENWRSTNPLVSDVFVATSAGALRWGGTRCTDVAAWLATKPWRDSSAILNLASPQIRQPISTTSDSDNGMNKPAMSESIVSSGNAIQYQNARVAMQTMAAFNNNAIAIAPPPQNESLTQAVAKIDTPMANEAKKEGASMIPVPAIVPDIDITSWTPWTDASGALHLFGWRLTSRGAVFVVEANLAAIASRLGEVLPRDIASDESYALFGDGNTQIARVDGVARVGRTVNIGGNGKPDMPARQIHEQPLGLPGWRVAGYTLADSASGVAGASGASGASSAPGAFFLVSALLVGLFVLAIIGGGSLLLRQARISAAESAQKTSFVANVSHEFKTPLTTIRLYAELLEQGRIRDDARRAESLQTISRETQRLARLVNNALDFSRLEQGRKKFDFAEYDMREEIARILDRHAPRLAEAGLKLTLPRAGESATSVASAAPSVSAGSDGSASSAVPVAPCVVKTDLDAVEQIVINLLDNACKYAASGGEVTVAVAQTVKVAGASSSRRREQDAPPTFTTITVADRGPGIPSSQREKIFEKFHRVDDTLTAAQGGAGLGLSIARQLARGLGGDLAYSPREGGGSEFTLTLH